MIAETSMLFAALACTALAVLALQIRRALPLVKQLRTALEAGPATRELRYTVREVIVVPASAKVLPFPVSQTPAPGQPGHWRKAA